MHFSKGVSPLYWSKIGIFSFLRFWQNRPGKGVWYCFRWNTSLSSLWKHRFKKVAKICIFPKGLVHGLGNLLFDSGEIGSEKDFGDVVNRKLASQDYKNTCIFPKRLGLAGFVCLFFFSFRFWQNRPTILVTNLETLVRFSPPQCWFGICSHLSAPKYAWLNIGEGEGCIWLRTKVWRVNVWNSEKIQDKCLLFQRFVTSIVE